MRRTSSVNLLRSKVAASLWLLTGLSTACSGEQAEQADLLGSTTSALTPATSGISASAYTLFESGQVRPLAISPNGKRLFAANTPDNRLEVFEIRKNGLQHEFSVSVGLEPVAVAARDSSEVWVVNHLSDSISVVKLTGQGGHVERTLQVGDEPRDIVFAGPGKTRAFITTAHRGQNVPYDPQLTTPGVGRADVWVFDAKKNSDAPSQILQLFTDTPRALAVSPDGSRVYAAGFHSGNKTTAISAFATFFEGMAEPATNVDGVAAPFTGLVVKHDGEHWMDPAGRVMDHWVKFDLPDRDVFTLDANANPPRLINERTYSGVGTVLYNMAVNPVSGKIYVSNTEARNEVRFEGPGDFAGSTVQGHNVENRISVLSANGSVNPVHLNKHIDRSAAFGPVDNPTNKKSLALPQQMVVSKDGKTLYVAALGSSKVGRYRTAELENDTFVPSENDQVKLSGGGPTGLVLDDKGEKLYVLNRFNNTISTVDTRSFSETSAVAMYNPEPESVTRGRRFLYDASFSSTFGDQACATCHVYGDFDSLAWDLGNPDAPVEADPNEYVGGTFVPKTFHPMKGPMTTQSLRGMANHGSMHWRGDRTGAKTHPSAEPDSGTFDELAAFKQFNPAFVSLLGRDAEIPEQNMQAFSDFIMQLNYPPNPIRALDNSLTADQQDALEFWTGTISFTLTGDFTCNDCHRIDAEAGFFGANGLSSFPNETQNFKIPHLRNMYQKVGMFGNASIPTVNPGDNEHMGEQVRGFGYIHDGSFDTLFRFNNVTDFTQTPENPHATPVSPEGMAMRRKLESLMLAMDSNLAPVVGQQVTLSGKGSAATRARIALLQDRAEAGDCDLTVKASLQGREAGLLYVGNDRYRLDRRSTAPIRGEAVRALAGSREITYTCVPPGSGVRVALDRDEDGVWDGDERHGGSDPADRNCRP